MLYEVITRLKEEILLKTTKEIESLGIQLNSSSIELDKINNQILELDNKVASKANDTFNKFKDNLNKLLEKHRENIVHITKEGESLEEKSFNDIKEKISYRSSNLLSILDQKLHDIEEINSSKISKLSSDMGNVELIAVKIKEENQERLDNIKLQIDNP